jgi:hypothetical protein
MKIIFKQDKPAKKLTFRDVKTNQFFVDKDGDLSIKYDCDSYFVIAHSSGIPSALHIQDVDYSNEIQRILPEVEKIEF